MRDLEWSRSSGIAEVRNRIWAYLSPASRRIGEEGLLIAAALLQWPVEDATRLAGIQYLMSGEVDELLMSVPSLLRKLSTSSSREEEWDFERLRGPVLWSRTLALRATGGSPQLWVTAPARRDYQTVENRMLVYLLDEIVALGRSSGWADVTVQGSAARIVQNHVANAEMWLQSSLLTQIDRAPLSLRDVSRVRNGRSRQRYSAVIAAYDLHDSLIKTLDMNAVRSVVENEGLVTASDAILFELICLFNVRDALAEAGWSMASIRLFHGCIEIDGTKSDGRSLRLYYQSMPAATATSLYKKSLSSHDIENTRELRPDMIISWETPTHEKRQLFVECKLSEEGIVAKAARRAVFDLLAYRQAFRDDLKEQRGSPFGLGLAWGEDLEPDLDAEIMLATRDTLARAIIGTVV